jgi:hypothetical protein
MSTPREHDELTIAEWEHLARLGGVDPHWLRLKWLVAGLLMGGRDASLPGAVPPAVTSAAAALLAELSSWWKQRPQLKLVESDRPDDLAVSPYQDAWHWIERNIASEDAVGLAKLLLSLSESYRAPFSFRECALDLDESCTELALRAVIHFGNFDDEDELTEICEKIARAFPRLVTLNG